MKQVRIPPDIGAYQERLFLNLTGRQALALALGGLTVWVLYAKAPLPRTLKDYLLLVLAPAILALGWIRVQGLPLERWLPILIAYVWLPQQRPWYPDGEED